MGILRFIIGIVTFIIAIKVLSIVLALVGFALKLIWLAAVVGFFVLIGWIIYKVVWPNSAEQV